MRGHGAASSGWGRRGPRVRAGDAQFLPRTWKRLSAWATAKCHGRGCSLGLDLDVLLLQRVDLAADHLNLLDVTLDWWVMRVSSCGLCVGVGATRPTCNGPDGTSPSGLARVDEAQGCLCFRRAGHCSWHGGERCLVTHSVPRSRRCGWTRCRTRRGSGRAAR